MVLLKIIPVNIHTYIIGSSNVGLALVLFFTFIVLISIYEGSKALET